MPKAGVRRQEGEANRLDGEYDFLQSNADGKGRSNPPPFFLSLQPAGRGGLLRRSFPMSGFAAYLPACASLQNYRADLAAAT